MCAVCTSSLGPDRYGPVYNGRFMMKGATSAQMPWLQKAKTNPNCPGCRVGAYQQGEALPPLPLGQPMIPAGQLYGPGQPYNWSVYPAVPVAYLRYPNQLYPII